LALDDEEMNAAQVLLDRIRQTRYSGGAQAGIVGELSPMIDRHLEKVGRRMRGGRRFPLVAAAVFAVAVVLTASGAGYAIWRQVSAPAGAQVVEAWQEANRHFTGGEEGRARVVLSALWQQGYRSGPLAAQCAVAALRDREIGTAAVWSERARRESPRDPFVRQVRLALDEEGGLPGHPEGLGTLLTWRDSSLIAALLFALASLSWAVALLVARRWRYVALSLGVLTILSGLVTIGIWQSGFGHAGAVALNSVPLYDSAGGEPQLDLEPGRMVRLIERRENWVHVGLGGGLRGWVPAEMIEAIDGTADPLPTAAFVPRP
jgi:hypothetical protein